MSMNSKTTYDEFTKLVKDKPPTNHMELYDYLGFTMSKGNEFRYIDFLFNNIDKKLQDRIVELFNDPEFETAFKDYEPAMDRIKTVQTNSTFVDIGDDDEEVADTKGSFVVGGDKNIDAAVDDDNYASYGFGDDFNGYSSDDSETAEMIREIEKSMLDI